MLHHEQLDSFTKEWLARYRASNKDVYCRAGCSGCCTLAVHATFPEAVNAAKELSQDQKNRLDAYIDRLLVVLPEAGNVKDYLKLHRFQIGPCPFLDETGFCSIYNFRPLSCRALLSTRPADWCNVDFSELDHWDKQAFETGLDKEVVAWPTHYVASPLEYACRLEDQLLSEMQKQQGWRLSGNFSVMTWLEVNRQISRENLSQTDIQTLLAEQSLDHQLILNLC